MPIKGIGEIEQYSQHKIVPTIPTNISVYDGSIEHVKIEFSYMEVVDHELARKNSDRAEYSRRETHH